MNRGWPTTALLVVTGCALAACAAAPPPAPTATDVWITGKAGHYTFALPAGFADLRVPGGPMDNVADSRIGIAGGAQGSALGDQILIQDAGASNGNANDLAAVLASILDIQPAGTPTPVKVGADLSGQSREFTGAFTGRLVAIEGKYDLLVFCLGDDERERVQAACDTVLSSIRLEP